MKEPKQNVPEVSFQKLAPMLEAGPSGAAHVHVSMRRAQQLPARPASDHATYACKWISSIYVPYPRCKRKNW